MTQWDVPLFYKGTIRGTVTVNVVNGVPDAVEITEYLYKQLYNRFAPTLDEEIRRLKKEGVYVGRVNR